MPLLKSKDGERELAVADPHEYAARLASGEWVPADDTPASFRGQSVHVPGQQYALSLGEALALEPGQAGFAGPDIAAQEQRSLEAEFSGPGQGALAYAEGLGNALLLGTPRMLAAGTDYGESMALREQAHPAASTAGELTAFLVPGTGEVSALRATAGAPLKAVSRVGSAVSQRLGVAAGAATENALIGAGLTAGDIMLHDPDVSAESLLAQTGTGALWSGAIGGGVGGLGAGIGKLARGRRAAANAELTSPILDLNSRAGRELADNVAATHSDLTALGEEVVGRARNDVGLYDKLAQSRRLTELEQSATVAREAGDALFSRAAGPAQAEGFALSGQLLEVGPSAAKSDIGREFALASQEHANIIDTLEGMGEYKASHQLQRHLGPLEKAARTGDREAVSAYNKAVVDSGALAGRDSAKWISDQLTAAGSPKLTGTTFVPGARVEMPAPGGPVAGARQAYATAREAFDSLGPLAEVDPAIAARASDDLFRATDNLARSIGHSPMFEGHTVADIEATLADAGRMRAARADLAPHIDAVETSASKMQSAFGLQHGERFTGPALAKVLQSGPDTLIPALTALDEYYGAVQALAQKTGQTAAADSLRDGLRAMAAAMEEKAGLSSLPADIVDTLGQTLGIDKAPAFKGPVGDLYKAAIVMDALGGTSARGARLAKTPLWRRITRAIGARSAAGAGGGIADYAVPAGAGGAIRGAIRGAGAAAGYHIFGAAYNALHATASVTGNAVSRIQSAVEHIAKGMSGMKRVGRYLPAVAVARSLGQSEATDVRKQWPALQQALAEYAANPDAAQAHIYDTLRPMQLVAPHLADEMEVAAARRRAVAYAAMPKDPGTMMLLGKSTWEPSDDELYKATAALIGAELPLDAIDMIADGTIPPQTAAALREANPALFRIFQQAVVENADAIRANATYGQVCALSIALDVPLNPSMTPDFINFVAQQNAQTQIDQAQATGGPTDGGRPEPDYTPAQRQADR